MNVMGAGRVRTAWHRGARAGPMVAGALLVFGSAAHADPPQRLAPGGDGGLVCQTATPCQTGGTSCSGNMICTTPQEATNNNDPGCAFSQGFSRDALCCGDATDCGTRGGVEGECVEVQGVGEDGEDSADVCVFPGTEFRLCRDSTSSTRDCFRDAYTNTLQDDWRQGDCDGDGTRNDADCAPCDPNQVCQDGGVASPDGGVDGGAHMDAGTAPGDAAVADAGVADAMPPGDAGMDGGTSGDGGPADGGPSGEDGGALDDDAGSGADASTGKDAEPGSAEPDGSTGPGQTMGGSGMGGSKNPQSMDAAAREGGSGIRFQGGGGCTALPGTRPPPLPALLVLSGLLVLRGRRRRS